MLADVIGRKREVLSSMWNHAHKKRKLFETEEKLIAFNRTHTVYVFFQMSRGY